MTAYKVKSFNKWSKKLGINDRELLKALEDIASGKVDAMLGGGIIKQRLAVAGRGKRGGSRIIIAYRKGKNVFLLEGFAKNEKDNITAGELQAFQIYGKHLQALTREQLEALVKSKELIELKE